MRSAIDRDADPQQMIPKLTCLLLKTGQAEFSELVQLRATVSAAYDMSGPCGTKASWPRDDPVLSARTVRPKTAPDASGLERSEVVVDVVVVARIENVFVIVGLVVDAKCGLLGLIQLVDDRAPHFLRDRGFHRVEDLAQLYVHQQHIPAVVPGVDQ